MKKVSIYTDGCCKKNPGMGGWGCYCIMHPGSVESEGNMDISMDVDIPITFSWYGGKKKTTNNEMELTAMYKALCFVPVKKDITIYADTQYGLKGLLNSSGKSKEYLDGSITKNRLGNSVKFTGWVDGWSQNEWKTSTGTPVANKMLWIKIMEECKRHVMSGSKLRFVWVKGHSGIEGNEIADSLANLGPKLFS